MNAEVEALVGEILAAAAIADPEFCEASTDEDDEDEALAAVEAVERAMLGHSDREGEAVPSPMPEGMDARLVAATTAILSAPPRPTAPESTPVAAQTQEASARDADLSDEAWFAKHGPSRSFAPLGEIAWDAKYGPAPAPRRTARLRAYQPSDGRPYWVRDGQLLTTLVRWMPSFGKPSFTVLPAEALASGGVADTDEAVLAAAREARAME